MMWLSGVTGIDMSDEYDSFPATASAAVAAAAMPVFMTVVQVSSPLSCGTDARLMNRPP